METDEYVLEFRDSSDDEQEPAKRERPELKEDSADNKFLIMSPGFGNHILNFFNPEDEQKLRFSEISTQNTNYLKKKSNDYRLPKKRKGAVNSSRSRVPIFVNKGIGVGPVIEMVHSSSSFMHSNQLNIPTDQSSLLDEDASSNSTTSSLAPNTDDNISSMLRDGFQSDNNQSSSYFFSKTLALFANASASCEAFETSLIKTKVNPCQRKVARIGPNWQRSPIQLKDRLKAVETHNRQLRAENTTLVQQVGLLATELGVKLPPVLKEFPNIGSEEIDLPSEELNHSSNGNLNETCNSPIQDDQMYSPATDPSSRKLEGTNRKWGFKSAITRWREKTYRIANQNTEIFGTNESLQTLIDKLYELQNSKNV